MSRSERRRANLAQNHGVMIAYLCPDLVNAQFQVSLRALEAYDANHGQRLLRSGDVANLISGPRVAAGRNELVRLFLGHPRKPDWLLMLDSDMVFPATLVDDLLASANPLDRPIVGGLCFAGGRSGEVKPTIGVLTSNDPPTYEIVWNYPPDALVGCDYTGAACLMVHRNVLEAMGEKYEGRAHKWFAESEFGGRDFGEDVTFCQRARAMGYPIYVDTSVKIGHMKMMVVDEQTYLAYRRGITAQGEDEYKAGELARRFVVAAR